MLVRALPHLRCFRFINFDGAHRLGLVSPQSRRFLTAQIMSHKSHGSSQADGQSADRSSPDRNGLSRYMYRYGALCMRSVIGEMSPSLPIPRRHLTDMRTVRRSSNESPGRGARAADLGLVWGPSDASWRRKLASGHDWVPANCDFIVRWKQLMAFSFR
jgi:hypothetical protein